MKELSTEKAKLNRDRGQILSFSFPKQKMEYGKSMSQLLLAMPSPF